MPKHANDRLQGTLDLLILKTLARAGSLHGYAIARRVHQATDDSLRIEEGSLYPALQRMTHEKWLRAQWGTTDTGRKARFLHNDVGRTASTRARRAPLGALHRSRSQGAATRVR
jgi:PadR family transcriptional regulator PadR